MISRHPTRSRSITVSGFIEFPNAHTEYRSAADPIATGGTLAFTTYDAGVKRDFSVGIQQVQIEQVSRLCLSEGIVLMQ